MSDKLQNNPFAQLFVSLDAAKEYAEKCSPPQAVNEISMEVDEETKPSSSENKIAVPPQHVSLNDRIERIFGIGLNKETENCVVYLEEVAQNIQEPWLDLNSLEQALFERLLLEEPSKYLLNSKKINTHITETKVISYLYQCYCNISGLQTPQTSPMNENLRQMSSLVLRNMSTALKQPELYSEQDLATQLLQLFSEDCDSTILPFIHKLVDELIKDEDVPEEIISTAFLPLFRRIRRDMAGATLSSGTKFFAGLILLSQNKHTANTMIEFSTPKNRPNGSVFEDTMFGDFLQLSCIPRTPTGEHLFFKKDEVQSHVEAYVWKALDDVHTFMYTIFFQLLKVSPVVKDKVISWLSDCLVSNAGRGKLQSQLDPMAYTPERCVSDAFMLNLSAVILRLCEPIISDVSHRKLLKIDPTFGAAEQFKKETCLLPAEDPENRMSAETYSFITRVFFLCHKAVALGFAVCDRRLVETSQELQRLYSAFRDAEAEAGPRNDSVESIRNRLNADTTRYMSLRAALVQPKYQDLLFDLNVTTCNWIVQALLDTAPPPRTDYCITESRQLTFPLPESVPKTFSCIPEFILENFNSFLPFLKRFNATKLEERGLAGLEPILTCIIVLTRGNKRVKNPHLRASLTESLEAMLPNEDDNSTFWRQQVFQEHPHCKEIVPSLLDVYVSIEMSGESVEDYKFKYRRAMSLVMEFLWKMEIHRECFKKLANEAEKNMEAVNPPIFLRFLNLLINDAVYLMDEALAKMSLLRTMQEARDAGEWQSLPIQERAQKIAELSQTGQMARSYNILSKNTLRILEILTEEIKSIFSHPTMVGRITAMLNLNLQHLVGPNKKNLKVKDQEKFDFKPIDIVLSICNIYAHLSGSDAFCLAISQDGRSYNEKLFVQAEEVLCRIGGSSLVPEIRAVANRVAESARKQKRQDELLSDAPEEFLDPIMNTIMTDPVILPTSHVTVDRHTISRHLLSDQTDPFNRSPLTMEMVSANTELKKQIDAWIASRQTSPASSENN